MSIISPDRTAETPPAPPSGLSDDPLDRCLMGLACAEAVRWARLDPSLAEIVEAATDLARRAGKRLRPALVRWGYAGAGRDRDDPAVVRVAAAMELLHAFALLHDDVMDGSPTRRGRPTLHERATAAHRSGGWRGESRRFGEGLAVLAGDLAFVYADRLLGDAPPEVWSVWHELRIELTMGQYLDMTSAARADHSVEGARRIARFKTAGYSVERPLHLGAAVAGRLDDLGPHYSAFGVPIGEAFQQRDDLLGAFGDSAVTGKPVGDDLRQGKPTVLVACARRRARRGAHRRWIERIGDPALTPGDLAAIQGVLVDCGAVAEVEADIASRVDEGLRALDAAPIDDDVRGALRRLALEAAWRES